MSQNPKLELGTILYSAYHPLVLKLFLEVIYEV